MKYTLLLIIICVSTLQKKAHAQANEIKLVQYEYGRDDTSEISVLAIETGGIAVIDSMVGTVYISVEVPNGKNFQLSTSISRRFVGIEEYDVSTLPSPTLLTDFPIYINSEAVIKIGCAKGAKTYISLPLTE